MAPTEKKAPTALSANFNALRSGFPDIRYQIRDVVADADTVIAHLSTALAGQAVGIKEVDDGIWLVIFMDYDLGYIDLEEKTLQP